MDGQVNESPWGERCLVALSNLAVLMLFLTVIGIGLIVLILAWPAIIEFGWSFLTGLIWNPVAGREQYGVFPMLYGTIITSFLALFIATPLGVAVALFITHDFIPEFFRGIIVVLIELLAAVPSVIYGLWGIYVLIPFLKPFMVFLHNGLSFSKLFATPSYGPGIFPAVVVLAIMILPTIVVMTRDSLITVRQDLIMSSYCLGATCWETTRWVVLPSALSGIFAGVMLALGRALGETMAVTLLIGNSNQFSISILAPGNTIASLIANQFAEASGLQVAALMYAAFVLLIITLMVNVLARMILRRLKVS
jgi:phosphate transport system permease protein